MGRVGGLTFWGVAGVNALVVASDSPTLVKKAAGLAKVVYGDRIQICTGTNDEVKVQAAIDSLGTNTSWWATGLGVVGFVGRTIYIDAADVSPPTLPITQSPS